MRISYAFLLLLPSALAWDTSSELDDVDDRQTQEAPDIYNTRFIRADPPAAHPADHPENGKAKAKAGNGDKGAKAKAGNGDKGAKAKAGNGDKGAKAKAGNGDKGAKAKAGNGDKGAKAKAGNGDKAPKTKGAKGGGNGGGKGGGNGGGTPPAPSPPTTEPPPSPTDGKVQYCYDPLDTVCGPMVWDQLPIPNNECGGTTNSPIAISKDAAGLNSNCTEVDYFFDRGSCKYKNLKYEILVDVIKATFPEDGSCQRPIVMIGDLKYEALQFHLHLDSEHTLEGRYFAAELHVVHQKIEGPDDALPFAVVGFVLESGSELGFFDPTMDAFIPGFIETARQVAESCDIECDPHFFYTGTDNPDYFVDPYSMLPPGPNFYQYEGGLTTPPCTQAVFWNLLTDPIQIGIAQIDTLTRLILEYIDPDTCEYATNADPLTGSTSRPPLDPLKRRIDVVGYCP